MSRLWYGLLDAVLPRRCIVCGDAVPSRIRSVPICGSDWDTVETLPPSSCRYCSRPMDTSSSTEDSTPIRYPHRPICGHCRKRELSFEFLLAAFAFTNRLRTVVSDWKYDGNAEWGAWLGDRLSEAVTGQFKPSRWDGLVPVPMYFRRRRERGFNQAEQLAEGLSNSWGMPLKKLVDKDRRTEPQSSLGRDERRTNLKNAFSLADDAEPPDGQRLLLVDDIYTTGSTLRTIGGVLERAGADALGGVVLARTPPD